MSSHPGVGLLGGWARISIVDRPPSHRRIRCRCLDLVHFFSTHILTYLRRWRCSHDKNFACLRRYCWVLVSFFCCNSFLHPTYYPPTIFPKYLKYDTVPAPEEQLPSANCIERRRTARSFGLPPPRQTWRRIMSP